MAPTDTALRWTHEKPTVPGFYWYAATGRAAQPVEVEEFPAGSLVVHFCGSDDFAAEEDELPGSWCGPITPPERTVDEALAPPSWAPWPTAVYVDGVKVEGAVRYDVVAGTVWAISEPGRMESGTHTVHGVVTLEFAPAHAP